jgi:ribonuclease P/MRP protein subunit RPP40
LLFLTFINDMPSQVRSLCNLFADDSGLSGRVRTAADCDVLQNDLGNLTAWSIDNLLPFNESKCVVLHLGKNNTRFPYSLNGTPLSSASHVKSLGVTITEDLKVAKQCAIAAGRANAMLGRIRRGFHHLTPQVLRALYSCYVRPHLEYCVQAWCPYFEKDKLVLERVQRRATKLAHGLGHLPYADRLKVLGLTTLEARRERGDLLEVHKILTGIDRLNPATFFSDSLAATSRGHSRKLQKPFARTLACSKSFAHRVVGPWNALPEDVVSATSANRWKAAYDKLIPK